MYQTGPFYHKPSGSLREMLDNGQIGLMHSVGKKLLGLGQQDQGSFGLAEIEGYLGLSQSSPSEME